MSNIITPIHTAALHEIDLGLIYRSARGRPINRANVERLKDSIEQVGLLNPICVRRVVRHNGPSATYDAYEIVAGNHRYEVAKALRWASIACSVVELDELHSELAEIDENLMRAGLSKAQEARAVDRRKAIYEELHPETKAGVAGGNARHGIAGDKLSFAGATAKATGRDVRTIERAAARGKALCDDLEAIEGTSLDKGIELDALAKMSRDDRQHVIQRAVAGEVVSAQSTRDKADIDAAQAEHDRGRYTFGPREPAICRQDESHDLHRLASQYVHARTCFPSQLRETIKARIWQFERNFANMTVVPPCSFHDFVHEQYPYGIGATYEIVEDLIRGARLDVIEAWEKETGRKVGGAR